LKIEDLLHRVLIELKEEKYNKLELELILKFSEQLVYITKKMLEKG